ncbi:MAG: polyhydroxyalkanoate synthesis repressor PhaR, partial [Phenylobacterium sp.]|nr:polyhydroxyalkanoate synthesis repressor PhaR [Phenylobacterium sp.]
GAYDDQIRQNLAMFYRAMKMFTPFANPPGKGEEQSPRSDSAPEPAAASDDTLKALQDQLAAMQAQINKLASKD